MVSSQETTTPTGEELIMSRFKDAYTAYKDALSANPVMGYGSSIGSHAKDMQSFRLDSERLDMAMRGDFSWFEEAAAEAGNYPKTAARMPQRYFKLVQRVAQEAATLYTEPPQRLFFSQEKSPRDETRSGKKAAPWVQKIRRAYRLSGVDEIMKWANRALIVQSSQVLFVLPGRPDAPLEQVQVLTASPYEVEIVPGDPTRAHDISSAIEVRHTRWPVYADDSNVVYGVLVLRADTAYVEMGGKRIGVYDSTLINPLGYIPAYLMLSEKPDMGRAFPPVAEDLLSQQIGLNLRHMDLEHGLKHSWPQKYINPTAEGSSPASLVESIPVGADVWSSFPDGQAGVLNSQPPVSAILAADTAALRMTAIMHDMSPDAFMKENSAKTAVSRAYDRLDQEANRKRFAAIFKGAEDVVARLVASTLNLRNAEKLPEDINVQINYVTREIPADPFQAAQARVLAYANGEDSPEAYVARRDGISLQAAKQRVADNRRSSTGSTQEKNNRG